MSTGYSLFEMTTYLVLAELALSLRVRPLSLLAAFYLIETVGYLVGCSLEAAADAGALDGRMVAAVLALALLVCAVWVFTEKHVNDLLWGRGGEPAAGVAAREPEGGASAEALEAAGIECDAGSAVSSAEVGDAEAVRDPAASGPYGQGVTLVASGSGCRRGRPRCCGCSPQVALPPSSRSCSSSPPTPCVLTSSTSTENATSIPAKSSSPS